MKPEQTVLRPLPGRSGLDPNFRPPDPWGEMFEEQRERAGLLPFPPLAKALFAVGFVLCIVASGFVGALLGWW